MLHAFQIILGRFFIYTKCGKQYWIAIQIKARERSQVSDEKRTYPTEVPFVRSLARAVLDINEALKESLKVLSEASDIAMVEKSIAKNNEFVEQLNMLLAEHGKETVSESRGLVFGSIITAARRLAQGTSQDLAFSYMRAWMTALQEQYNAVQTLQLSQTLSNLLAEQVGWVNQYRIEFGERYLELKD